MPYSAGTAFLDVVPSFRGVQQAIAKELRNMESSLGQGAGDKFGEEFGKRAQTAVDKALNTSTSQATQKAATKNANDAADAFSKVFKTRMKNVVSALPEIKFNDNLSDIEKRIRAVKTEAKALSNVKISGDFDANRIMARAAEVEKVVDRLSREREIPMHLAFDSKAVVGELATLRKVVDGVLGNIEVEVKPTVDGAAAKLVQARLEQAIGDFTVTPDLNTGEVDREAEALRLRLVDLRELHINGYLDVSDVVAGATEIEVLLKALESDRHEIEIKTNATGALKAIAEITALGAATNDTRTLGERLRATLLGEGGDADSAANSFRGFSGIVLGIAAGLPLLVPLLAAVGAGMLALGAAGAGVVAGLGVLIFAFGGVGDAVKAMDADQKAAGQNAVQNARTMRDAAAAVAQAEQGVTRARENAGRAAEAAARQVSDAIDSQKDAEQDLVRAQAEVVRAQEAVTQAREDARDRIEDLRLSIQGGALAERQAVLDLAKAEDELATAREKGTKGPELEQLLINLERRRLGLKEIRLENGRLGEEQAEVNRTGIEGSREVVSAQDGVKRAQEGVTAAMGRVADAGRAVSDAIANQQQVQKQSAQSISDAQAGLAKAQQAYTDALYDTGVQGSATGRAVSDAFGKLGPAGQIFALFLQGVRNDFRDLRDITQAGIFPGLQDAISSILTTNGPLLREFLGSMSQTIGNLFRELGDLLTSAQWKAIFADFNTYAPVFMKQFGEVGMNLLTFFGGLFQAFAPMAKSFGDWIVDTTAKMRDWALGLKGSEKFKDFMAYISETGPRVWALFRDILTTILDIAQGIAPFAGILLGALDSIFSFLAALDPHTLGAITTAVIGLTIAFQLAHGAITLAHQGLDLFKHGMSKWIFVAGAAVTVLTALYTSSQGVRDFFSWMTGILGDVVDLWEKLPGPIQLAVGAMGAFALLRGPLGSAVGGIKGILDGLALKAMYARDAASGLRGQLTSIQGAAGLAKSGASKFMNFLGGPWGIAIGLAVTGIGYLISSLMDSGEATKNAEGYQKDLTAALRDSKGAIDDNIRAMAAQKAQDTEFGDSNLLELAREAGVALPRVTDALLGNRDAAKEVQKALRDYAESTSYMLQTENGPIKMYTEQGQAALDAADSVGTMTGSMRGAQQANKDLAVATGETTRTQEELDAAADKVNEALALQQQTMIDMYEAQKGFEDATSDLAGAHQAVADALKAEGAGSEAYKDALSDLEDQSYRTAQAAGKVAEARHTDSEGAELQLWNNAALLENLRAQEKKYGELPPRLAQLKASLEEQVPAAYQAATQFENLGLKINQVPNSKTVVVDSSTTQTQLDKMRDLGFSIKELPDGSYEVTAETDDAVKALDVLTADRTVSIYAQAKWEGINKRVARENRDFQDQFGLPHKAAGGPIYGPGGPTSDSILARLSNGEYVVKAASVQKYGVQFLEAINAGRFATGGYVGRMIPKFAGGGLAANWGGTINMSGGDTNPLAAIWFEAIAAINQAAASGSAVIASHFSSLRNSVKSTLSGLSGEAGGIWRGLMGYLVPSTKGMQGNVGGIFGLLKSDTTGKVSSLGAAVKGLWAQMGGSVRGETSKTAGHNSSVFGSMKTGLGNLFGGLTGSLKSLWAGMGGSVRSETSKTTGHNSTTFGAMRTNTTGIFSDTIGKVKATWNQIAGITQKPINFVINSVLNNGLFKAFNGIVGTLGLPKTWKIPTAQPVPNPKLAAGGRVPGWSASDTHDNIPAWLTANEYVLPVAATRRLRQTVGDEGLESLRRGMLPQFASGGLVAFGRRLQSMGARVSEHPAFGGVTPGAHVAGSMHYKGRAIDVNTRPGTSAQEQRELSPMMALARQLGFNVIFMSSGHYNHGHVDDRSGGSSGSGNAAGTPAWYDALGSAAGVLKKLTDSIRGGGEVDKRFGASSMSTILEAMPGKALGWIWGKAKDTIGNMFTGVLDSIKEGIGAIVAPFRGDHGVTQAAVKLVAKKYGWDSGNEWNALGALINKESGWNPNAQNPTSTAYGLFQFLNGTWPTVGGHKTSNPGEQAEYGMRYLKERYGSPSKAWAFHQSHNWYGEGGEVGADGTKAEVPTLYDTGGWLPPGLTTVMNATGRPEPILTGDQWDALLQTGGGNGGIEQLHIHEVATDIEEAIGAVNHISRVLAAGGRYSGRSED